MKKSVGILAMAVASICATTVATQASILVNDNFNRANGNLVGTNPTPGPGGTWAAHSGAGALPVQISSGQIGLAQGSGSREDVNAPAGATMGAGDRWYAAFNLVIADPAASITDTYFAMFLQGTSNFNGRVWVTAPTSAGYRLALSNDSSITDSDGEAFTGDLVFGQSYRVVVSYDFTGQNASLWLDQALESGSSIAATDPGFSNAVSAFAFRQAAGNTTQTIDDLCVATTYGEAYTCVPEPATLGLLAMGALALIRRRR